MLESSLRTLIEHLVLSDTAKYGTWASVRPLGSPQRTSSTIRDVATYSYDRSVLLTWQISFEAIKSTSSKAAALLDAMANARSAPVPLLMPKQVLSNTPLSGHYFSADGYHLSKSGMLTPTGSGAIINLLRLRLPNLPSTQTDRRKIARLHLWTLRNTLDGSWQCIRPRKDIFSYYSLSIPTSLIDAPLVR